MDRLILLFLHKDIRAWTLLSFPYLSIVSIINYTLRRNKTIHSNRITALQFILSGKAERRKRINHPARSNRTYTHRRARYINANKSKGNCKNSYQGVVSPMNGGNRP